MKEEKTGALDYNMNTYLRHDLNSNTINLDKEIPLQEINLNAINNNIKISNLNNKDSNNTDTEIKINNNIGILNNNIITDKYDSSNNNEKDPDSKITRLNYSEFIEKIGITKNAKLVFLLANFIQFIWGMEATFIAINVERLATSKLVPLSTKSILISVLYGMIGIGSALMGHLTKVFGRIKLIVITTIIYCLFVLLCSLPIIQDFYIIYAFRCIANIALGIFNISIINLLTEYLPIKNRSYILMVNSGLYNFGNIFLIIINNILLSDMNKNFDIYSWRRINLLCGLPGLISLIFSIFYVEESPLYLINNQEKNENNCKKAFKILKEMSKQKNVEFNDNIFNAIKNNTRNLESFKLKSNYSELFYSNYIRLTLCNILICTICYLNMIGISYVK